MVVVVVVVVVGFHFRLTSSLVSGEGALKRFKLATPMRRIRVCPSVDPQPRDFPMSLLESAATARSVGLCGVFSAVVPCPSTVGHSF